MISEKKRETPTIGIEIHVELKTDSKMFCGCINEHFGIEPNTHTCPVCIGLPGALPVPNRKAVEWTIMIGLALNCKVSVESKFDRKHYFYPDLPKGYQISQYDEPLCAEGYLETAEGRVGITRVHLEEDTGKLLHKNIKGENVTLVDFNRSGVPLVEIVTEPDIHSASQAKDLAQKLRTSLRYLDVSDCDMEKGSMRLEANISWGEGLGYKVEIKNLNSFRFVERAIEYELKRQKRLLNSGKIPRQETRGWNEVENKTESQRYKESAADYRYFPEPDIPPLQFTKSFIESIRSQLPELPQEIEKRLHKQYKLKPQYIQVIIADKKRLEYTEEALKKSVDEDVSPDDIAGAIVNRKVNIEKTSPLQLVKDLKQKQSERVSDQTTLEAWVNESIKVSPKAVQDYRSGKTKAISVLIGKVMQLSKGRADASKTKHLLEKKLQ